MSKLWVVIVMIGIAMVTAILLFTAEGAPSTPYLTSGTNLNPGSAQVFTWTAQVTVMGTQPINSIDEQGAWYTFSVYQNGHPVSVNQRVALGVTSQSGTTYTLQVQPTVGLPALCTPSAAACQTENVSIYSYATIPGWTHVYLGGANNITFSTVSTFTSVQKAPATPSGAFLFNSAGVLMLGIALDLTIGAAAFCRGYPHVWAGAGVSWALFVGILLFSMTGA